MMMSIRYNDSEWEAKRAIMLPSNWTAFPQSGRQDTACIQCFILQVSCSLACNMAYTTSVHIYHERRVGIAQVIILSSLAYLMHPLQVHGTNSLEIINRVHSPIQNTTGLGCSHHSSGNKYFFWITYMIAWQCAQVYAKFANKAM
jgi:hypothetical protein